MWKKKPLSVMEFPDQPKFSCAYTHRKKNQRENKQKCFGIIYCLGSSLL